MTYVLKAMQHGSTVAAQQLPRLLQIVQRHPNTATTFTEKVRLLLSRAASSLPRPLPRPLRQPRCPAGCSLAGSGRWWLCWTSLKPQQCTAFSSPLPVTTPR